MLAPPSVWITEPQTVKEGERVVLSCSVEGNPLPATVWKKEETSLLVQDNARYSITPTQLIVHRALAADAGKYLCIAVNDYGKAVAETELNVQAISEYKHYH